MIGYVQLLKSMSFCILILLRYLELRQTPEQRSANLVSFQELPVCRCQQVRENLAFGIFPVSDSVFNFSQKHLFQKQSENLFKFIEALCINYQYTTLPCLQGSRSTPCKGVPSCKTPLQARLCSIEDQTSIEDYQQHIQLSFMGIRSTLINLVNIKECSRSRFHWVSQFDAVYRITTKVNQQKHHQFLSLIYEFINKLKYQFQQHQQQIIY
ncbi:Hypothetical_protein [Hexamita inflata]|uniref:Hypothetical_protein n=1 Tax=Hexamita inflata TaxID=28002 RepID=A0AA86VG13_9EUKA|nr:Hypothetical protein HINF_LOCUS53298 [Hexamita inflata]